MWKWNQETSEKKGTDYERFFYMFYVMDSHPFDNFFFEYS